MKSLSLLFLVLNLTFASADAGCLDRLRELFSSKREVSLARQVDPKGNVEKVFNHRLSSFVRELRDVKKKADRQAMSTMVEKALEEFLSSSQGTSGIKRFIEILLVKMRNSSTWSRWVLDLQNALFQEYLLPENAVKLEEFRKTQEIDETIMVTVLSKRSKEGGFSGRVEELTVQLLPNEFAEHLKEGILLNDLTFQGKRHGALIHMWHVDMMIYLAKSMKKNPEIVSELYRWMGENVKYENDIYNFSSLRVWDVLFDAYDTGFNQPETISPKIYRYFGMTL